MEVHAVNVMAEIQTANVAYFQKEYQIIQIVCISRGFAISINPEKWSSTLLYNHSFTVLIHVIWYIK